MKPRDDFDFGFDLSSVAATSPAVDAGEDYDFGFDAEPAVADFGYADGFDFEPDRPEPVQPDEIEYVRPQPGPQYAFLKSPADIAIYGGAAGGGKSFALLLDPLRHHDNPQFGGVIFRRNSKQVRNEGGLWHESLKVYGPLGAEPRIGSLDWVFPSGMRMGFGHLEYDSDVQSWQGAQIPWIGFDELTHFTRYQFFYMMSRNRSSSGVPGTIRATCNPDVDSWVRKFIDWWIDEQGWAIRARAGKLRWFINIDDNLIWADTREQLVETYGAQFHPTSVTFIPARLRDNKKLMEKDPTYLARLMALPKVERMRLLGDHRGGNWNIRNTAGTMFRREWFPVKTSIPPGWISSIRFWDRGATPVTPQSPDPDWTRGLRLLRYPGNQFLIVDLRSMRDTPNKVEELIRTTAEHDGHDTLVMAQTDPGSAGKTEAWHFIKLLTGFPVETEVMTKAKAVRARPVSAQVQAGNVSILRAPWNDSFFAELENFPEGTHDDCVDVLSGAFNKLAADLSILNLM